MIHSVQPIGLDVYGVKIDDSVELKSLISKAENYKDLPFEEKLNAVKELAKNAMSNAYENYRNAPEGSDEKRKFHDIVFTQHSLGDALKEGTGCCRYQAVLFLILGAAAKLGDKHYVQSSPITSELNTCFNDVVYQGNTHHVSIFYESLKDKKNNYTQDPTIYDCPTTLKVGRAFLSYEQKEGHIDYHLSNDCHADKDKVEETKKILMFRRKMNPKRDIEEDFKYLGSLQYQLNSNSGSVPFTSDQAKELGSFLRKLHEKN